MGGGGLGQGVDMTHASGQEIPNSLKVMGNRICIGKISKIFSCGAQAVKAGQAKYYSSAVTNFENKYHARLDADFEH